MNVRGGQAILPVLLLTAASVRADAIDHYVRAEMQRRHIPGVAIAVVQNGRVLKQAAYGLANIEWNVPVSADTSFEIASMSKQFTDAGILLLSEEGRLSLEDPISKYLRETPPSWRDITLRQLMNHTSGLRDDWDEETPYFLENDTNEKFVAALEKAPLKFEPGDGFSYSCGPFLLGLVIERVSGQPYAQFMAERVFQPLGMHHTTVNDASAIVKHRASGYRWAGGKLIAGARISPAAEARGDVGISTTAGDLVKWDAALERPLYRPMFVPATLRSGERVPYGLGWFVQPYRGHRLLMHPGGFRTGFNSVIERFPDDRLTVIVLTNLQTAMARTLGYGIAGILDRDFRSSHDMAPRQEPRPARANVLRDVLVAVANGSIERAKFESLHAPMSLVEAREFIHDIGEITYLDRIPVRRTLNLFGDDIVDVRLYKVRLGNEDTWWCASFRRDGTIDFLDYEED